MPTRQNRRRGIATLEFVLVFPLLMALVAGLFLIARADTRKTLTATAARNEAWKQRANANPGLVLELGNDPITSAVTTTQTRNVERGPLFPKDTFTATTKFTATGRTWDYRDVPFRPGRGPMNPHLDELFMIAKSVTNLGGILNNVAGIAGKLVVP